jgi:hypothetical protein
MKIFFKWSLVAVLLSSAVGFTQIYSGNQTYDQSLRIVQGLATQVQQMSYQNAYRLSQSELLEAQRVLSQALLVLAGQSNGGYEPQRPYPYPQEPGRYPDPGRYPYPDHDNHGNDHQGNDHRGDDNRGPRRY